MKRLGLAALVTAGVACGPAPNLLPVNDFNRPTDVAFMCFGAFPTGGGPDGGVSTGGSTGQLQVSGRPMQACHPQDQYDPGPTTTTRTFAFMPNSAAGTLSAVDADHWKLVDLNLDTAGYGTAPLGQDPEQISVSDDGCRLISANRASCDLTIVDPSVLVAPTLSDENGGPTVLPPPSPRTFAQTFRPLKGDGTPLVSAPYEAVFLPQDTGKLLTPSASTTLPLLPTQNFLCSDSAAVDPYGWTAPPIPNSWYALVTYPSCDLIVLVALPSGNIVSSAYVRRTADDKNVTLVSAGTTPSCPVSNCAGQALPPGTAAVSADASPGTGGSTVAAPPADASMDMSTGAGGAAGSTGAAGAGGSGGTVDGGSADGGGGTSGGATLGNQNLDVPYFGQSGQPLGPSSIAILPNGQYAYVSLANASFVVSVGLSGSPLAMTGKGALAGAGIYLHEGARGSTRIRLNVDPTRVQALTTAAGATTAHAGVFVGAEEARENETPSPPNFPGTDPLRKYLYAIARDGTLRVISVSTPGGGEYECETNADPLNLPSGALASTACIGVDPSHRRPFSVGPGIHFPSLPVDVAAADIVKPGTTPPGPVDIGEQSVNGAHAWVITDSGTVYLVNINPVLRNFTGVIQTPPGSGPFVTVPNITEAVPFVNTIRDRNKISYSVVLDTASGPPRVDVLPAIPPTGPYVEPFWTQGSILNSIAVSNLYVQTVAFFPQAPSTPENVNDPVDVGAITPQTWSIAWEGALMGQRNTGNPLSNSAGFSAFPAATSGLDGALVSGIDSVFQDGGENFCAAGVLPGDLVTLTGCTSNGQCGIGEVCVQGEGGSAVGAGLTVTGLCVDPNQANAQEAKCNEFLNSVRRYEVVGATPNVLLVRPHLDEIVISPLEPACTPEPTSGTDGGTSDGGSSDGGTSQPAVVCPDVNDPTTENFRCLTSYPGVTKGPPRCLMTCSTDNDCRGGRVCIDFANGFTASNPSAKCSDPKNPCYCADAPVFDDTAKSCFDQLVSYQVSAGKSFVVAGSTTGMINTTTLPSSGGLCNPPDPKQDPRFIYRIPMNAPRCTNVDPSIAAFDSRIDPDSGGSGGPPAATDAMAKLLTVATTGQPFAPCLYIGGPVSGDPPTTPIVGDGGAGVDAGVGATNTHVRAFFRNSQLSFVVANLDRSPSTQFLTGFDVHGGFGPQAVYDPTTVEVSMPARIILGPVDSLSQITSGPLMQPTSEAPYLFVVDQRRLGREQGGGPTRGQLLRINPLSYAVTVGSAPTGYQPIFEDYNATGGLFPIQ